MKDFLQKVSTRLRMQGRYGIDAFSIALLVCAAVFAMLGCIPGFLFFFLYTAALVTWSCIRIFSKNINKRESEQDAYESMAERMQENSKLRKRKWADRKTYRYFRCKYCDTVFRIPKGKGKVSVTCPGCKEKFIKKT